MFPDRPLAAVLALASLPGLQGPTADLPRSPITWETLAARMEAEVKQGFSGAVLLVHEGKIVHEQGYGFADREQGIAVKPDTIFAIGSTPIDFTRAATLLLVQEELVTLEDRLGDLFPEAPEDKRPITLGQLLSGRSGLVDFVDEPGDRDPDHAWIERAEFLRRVFASKLLFTPGQGNEHSHAAFGVLAAVIEEVSGQSYPEFCRARLFAPAGMQDTGFFGAPIPPERLALGYGFKKDGTINAPPHWGKTSWLVMGSGGQTSTLRDLRRWHEALYAGKLLDAERLRYYFPMPGAFLNGGDMYGFEIYYTQGEKEQLFVVTNSSENRARRRAVEALAHDLAELVARR
jgi:CubicO group peptidase (beta-lactamase class C family)